jgi:Fibronectin type III domain
MTQMFMWDDVNASLIPRDATAVAGYVDGAFANTAEMRKLFPHAHLLTISVFASDDAQCLDVEPGDATNPQVYEWFKRQLARGVHRPVIYTSGSNMSAMQATMKANGFARSSYRMWSAHYTGIPHRCSPSRCGFGLDEADATQFTSMALGRSLDESLLAPDFFPPPAPTPIPMVTTAHNPVTGISVTPRFTQADVSWDEAQRAVGYRVVVRSRWTRRLAWRGEQLATFGGRNSVTVKDLKPGKRYTVTVMATPQSKWAETHRSKVNFITK